MPGSAVNGTYALATSSVGSLFKRGGGHHFIYAFFIHINELELPKLDTLILPTVNTACMQIFLEEVASRYQGELIVMVADCAGWHRSAALKIPSNVVLMQLPPYSPELNLVEHLWDDLREKSFGNLIFDSMKTLKKHLAAALKKFEMEVERVNSIVAWPWIVNDLFN